MLIATFVGLTVGLSDGYFGGWLDNALMRLVDCHTELPTFFLLIIVLAATGDRLELFVLVIGFTRGKSGRRLVRGRCCRCGRGMVPAARVLGAATISGS